VHPVQRDHRCSGRLFHFSANALPRFRGLGSKKISRLLLGILGSENETNVSETRRDEIPPAPVDPRNEAFTQPIAVNPIARALDRIATHSLSSGCVGAQSARLAFLERDKREYPGTLCYIRRNTVAHHITSIQTRDTTAHGTSSQLIHATLIFLIKAKIPACAWYNLRS